MDSELRSYEEKIDELVALRKQYEEAIEEIKTKRRKLDNKREEFRIEERKLLIEPAGGLCPPV